MTTSQKIESLLSNMSRTEKLIFMSRGRDYPAESPRMD